MAASRPMVSVQGEASEQAHLPAVFTAPIRQDVVQQVCSSPAALLHGGDQVSSGQDQPRRGRHSWLLVPVT